MLASEEYGKDLASVQNLLKKHQLLEADVAAHEVCVIFGIKKNYCLFFYTDEMKIPLMKVFL